MSESKSTLVRGIFIREFVSPKGTRILNVAFNVAEIIRFLKDNYNKDKNGNCWTNTKFVPNKNVGENKLSHTALLDDFYFNDAESALKELADEFLEETDENIAKKEQAIIEADKQASLDELPM
tara:strand:- start:13 stop:381 length:369 start_codon:yes stop_codon:yes gene_type:complete